MLLVVGSTGILGNEIVRLARCLDWPVRALARSSANKERLDRLRSVGAEIVWGDLKDPDSLVEACEGIEAVISTASSTLSRQPGDTLDSVDREGQLSLVSAAQAAGVRHFTFFGLSQSYGRTPLVESKRKLEESVLRSGMEWTNFVGNFFMEIWLSPALGFDIVNRKATLFGSGEGRNHWVSYRNVAEAAVMAHRTASARNRTFGACGPQALSQKEVVAICEKLGGVRFELTEIPEEELIQQVQSASDPLLRSFAGLQLACATGVAMDPEPWREAFGLQLISLESYLGFTSRT